MRDKWPFGLAAAALFFVLVLVYANHFHSEFHFDDGHTILNNPYIRNLNNAPLFFADARTFSTLPANQMYRPLFTLSAAVDYRLGKLDPFYFHLSNFSWYLVQLGFMFFLFLAVFDKALKHEWNKWLALFGVGWYGLHTANAETINYISARSDSFSTLFVVIALVMYACSPLSRKLYLYLIPFILGVLFKPVALMFAPLLFIYILFFEERSIVRALVRSWPAFILAVGLYVFQQRLTPPSLHMADTPLLDYLITQPFVVLHYFKTFFLPTGLSADYDWAALSSVFNPKFVAGSLFIIIMLLAAWLFSRKEKTRPVAFGLLWFLIALIPSSSIVPLAEVLNDHRMFFPFIGLTIGVSWLLGLLVYEYDDKIKSQKFLQAGIVVFCLALLAAHALGTVRRNMVWQTEESLWYDVTLKSPKNGRGLMNYGLTQAGRGDYRRALSYYQAALKYTSRYPYLFINMAAAYAALGDKKNAEINYKKAIRYGWNYFGSHFYYGDWLFRSGRPAEAVPFLKRSIEMSPGFMAARHDLLKIYAADGESYQQMKLARETLKIDPHDNVAPAYLLPNNEGRRQLKAALAAIRQKPTAENYLNLSLADYKQGNFRASIRAAGAALEMRPAYVEAYNNIGSAYNELGEWDRAINALAKALKIDPDCELARNNLKWAKAQKAKLKN